MTASVAPSGLRSGVPYWWHSYLMMVRWELTSLRMLMVLTVIVQLLIGSGFVLGVGLFFEDIPPIAALYVSTGVAVVTLITVGLVMGPQLIAQQKSEQTYDFLWSLPVPRTTAALGWLTVNLIIALPGMLAALFVALWRYDIDLDVTWSIVPAVTVVLLTGTMIGYAMAHAIPSPTVTGLITQLLIFVILGFSPINFPPEQLPAWLASIHDWLPFLPMADLVRAGLTEGIVDGLARSYVVVGVWAVASIALAALVLGRRK